MINIKNKNFKKDIISIIIAMIFSLLVFYFFVVFQKEEITSSSNLERFNALSKLTDIANDLESEINSAIVYTDFFSIIISYNPDIKPEILEMYSSLALKYNKNIKSVQFAPNAVIQTVYPLAGNEAAIGHDLLGDPARTELTKKAIDKRVVVLQGPVLAKQGGFLLFNRKAIFIEKNNMEQFWGLAVVAIDFDKVLEKYQTSLNDVNYLFSLRTNNENIKENLFGVVDIFEKKSIIKEIKLPEVTWELAIYPKDGWKDEQGFFKYFNTFFYFVFFIIFVLLYLTVKNYLEKLDDLKLDSLTGTLNKKAIKKVINRKLNKESNPFYFLVIDVNDFKSINDTLGHYVGDCVLTKIASRIGQTLRVGDSISRFGGDEYIVILDNLKNDDVLEEIIKRMGRVISKPIIVDGYSLNVTVSIGWANYPSEATSYDELYKIADKKMYEYKNKNKIKLKSTYEKYHEERLSD